MAIHQIPFYYTTEPPLCELIYNEFTKVFPQKPRRKNCWEGERLPSNQDLCLYYINLAVFQDDFQMIAAYDVALDNLLADDGFHTVDDETL